MGTAKNSRVLRTIPLLIAVCLLSFPIHPSQQRCCGERTQAQSEIAGDSGLSAQTSRYVFLADQSSLVQTGGIAGVYWTYLVGGQFQLTVNPYVGTASFAHVDANAIDESPLRRILDPGEVFTMTTLVGTVLSDTTLEFTGKVADGSDVRLTVTLQNGLAHLVAETSPPAGSADFFIFNMDAVAQRQYGGGTGTAEGPYLVYTAEQMNEVGANQEDWDKHFKLMADIDLSGYSYDRALIAPDTDQKDWWFQGACFSGVFDGNGHTISHLTVAGGGYLGLFGQLASGAVVKGLGLVNVNITGSANGNWCDWYVGGLVGRNSAGGMIHCYSTGTISGNRYVGGLVGSGGGVTNCYSTGSVSGQVHVGGLVGDNSSAVTHCYSSSTVTGDHDVGGLVGTNWGAVTHCESSGTVDGRDCIGGLVGGNNGGDVQWCYSNGTVSGVRSVGGLVGWSYGAVSACYSTSAVSGDRSVGGLMGANYGSALNCYSTAVVRGSGQGFGGLVGSGGAERVAASFWDIEVSGLTMSAGGAGLATAQMQTASTFIDADWDFVDETANGTEDIWWIVEGQDYPRLVREFSVFSPDPQDGATGVIEPVILRWAPGASTLQHDVYLSEDEDAVRNATTAGPEYKGSRDLGRESYYP